MSDTGFKFTGLDELQEDIAKCVAQYPEETSKKIYNLAGQFTKEVNKKFQQVMTGANGRFQRTGKGNGIKHSLRVIQSA